MSGKIQLLPDRIHRHCATDTRIKPITMALPFYRKKQGKYVHRVRSGSLFTIHAKPHMSFTFWCGNSGHISEKGGQLFANPPEHSVFCATCEGRVIGAGLEGARKILGRTVLYSPRI